MSSLSGVSNFSRRVRASGDATPPAAPIIALVRTTASIRFTVTPAKARASAEERARLLASPGFGRLFTEHMISIQWDGEHGWHEAALRPYGPVQLDPATSYLHYAQGVFEGLKAFRQ